jgi:hypothetical protein
MAESWHLRCTIKIAFTHYFHIMSNWTIEANSLMLTEVTGSVPPPIPATQRVGGCEVGRHRLRVQYDDVVQFTDLIISSVARKNIANLIPA